MIDPKSWNQFVVAHSSPASFLQSFEWGQFQEALGNRVYRLEISDSLRAQVVVKKLPIGRSYLEVAKGPIVNLATGNWRLAIGEFEKRLQEIGRQEKAVLARMNPPYDKARLTLGEGWRKPEILLRQTEPENTVLVDLQKSEEELMANMHEKSRYNIRLAQKKGVKVELATQSDEAFASFLALLQETAQRDGIVSWPVARFRKFRETFMPPRHSGSPKNHGFFGVPLSSPTSGEEMKERESPRAELPSLSSSLSRRGEGLREGSNHSQGKELKPNAELLIGELNGKTLAAAVIMLFGDAGTYLYAASSAENRSANAPSLVLWEAIKLAKARGKKWYDLWGVAPKDEPNHPWAGITRFKTRYVKPGVTGKEIVGVGARDLILDKTFYTLFKLYKLFRG